MLFFNKQEVWPVLMHSGVRSYICFTTKQCAFHILYVVWETLNANVT